MPTSALAPTAKHSHVVSWIVVAVTALNVPLQLWDYVHESVPWYESSGLAALFFGLTALSMTLEIYMDRSRAKRVVTVVSRVSAIACFVVVFARILRH